MAHEITNNDGLALAKTQAWHGLGRILPDNFTPREGLKYAGLDKHTVIQLPLKAELPDGTIVEVPNYVMNYREDTQDQFGIVSSNYQIITNGEVADFCEALSNEEFTVKCETVGSVQGGRRVWFLLKGEEFAVANDDQIFPYLLVSNGHDGSAPFRVTPTTIRAVCSNTLHSIIPRYDTGELLSSALVLKHTCNVLERVTQAREALQHYHKRINENRELMNKMYVKDVNTAQAQQFFLDNYTRDFGDIPTNPQNKVEQNRRDRAADAYSLFSRRFDDERTIAGASVWNCLNAYTGLVQHDKKARGQNDVDRVEKRINSNLFGLNQVRSQEALKEAFKMLAG